MWKVRNVHEKESQGCVCSSVHFGPNRHSSTAAHTCAATCALQGPHPSDSSDSDSSDGEDEGGQSQPLPAPPGDRKQALCIVRNEGSHAKTDGVSCKPNISSGCGTFS